MKTTIHRIQAHWTSPSGFKRAEVMPPNYKTDYDTGWYAGRRAMYSRFHGAIQQRMPHAIDLV